MNHNSPSPAKAQRVLACLLCQQRKVKCDRKFPCSNCVRIGALPCVPATAAPRQRRRRFAERELLARIRHYEELLHQHNVQFEPLHPTAENSTSPSNVGSPDPHSPHSQNSTKKAAGTKATNVWHALSHKVDAEEDGDDSRDDESDGAGGSGFLRDDHDVRDAVIKNTWDRTYHNASASNHHLLFGSPGSAHDVSLVTLHPDQAKIFRLWQLYLNNVNPLLKVTHTLSLQARIVDAIGNLSDISAPLEALLFSIYCVSIMSVAEDQCQTMFGSAKKDLLSGYHFACRQALLNANVLQSDDHDCLTALYLYLISARPSTDPRSLASVLAVAIRTAQRLGYHNESNNEKCNPLEAEMRRRLWWSLVIFDNRICETFNYRTPTLAPTWDCSLPLNVNDFELLPDMKTVPEAHQKPTEALFMVVRTMLSDLVRHCTFHLDGIDPFLTTFARAKSATDGTRLLGGHELRELQTVLEEKTLAFCDPENPLHFMAMWTARGYLAKLLLMEQCSRQTDAQQQDLAVSYALTMLECDTQLMNSPLTKGFHWHIQSHFPFLGYACIVQHLKSLPADQEQVARAWQVMSNNYDARGPGFSEVNEPIFVLFSRVVLQAWEAVLKQDKASSSSSNGLREPPPIVANIKSKLAQMNQSRPVADGSTDQTQTSGDMDDINLTGDLDGSSMPMLVVEGQSLAAPIPSDGYYPGLFPGDVGSAFMDMDQFWPSMDWGLMQGRR